MAHTIERRVPPGGGIVIGIVLGIMLWLSLISIARAQEPAQRQFLVFVDTAGVAPVANEPGMYITWVFAKSTPTSYPSSGILVMWDCLHSPRIVKRIAQVVYHMTPDSTGVTGNIEEVNRPWQEVTDERMADLVCRIGSDHDGTNHHPYFAPGKPRADA